MCFFFDLSSTFKMILFHQLLQQPSENSKHVELQYLDGGIVKYNFSANFPTFYSGIITFWALKSFCHKNYFLDARLKDSALPASAKRLTAGTVRAFYTVVSGHIDIACNFSDTTVCLTACTVPTVNQTIVSGRNENGLCRPKKHTCSSLAISRTFLNNTIRWKHHTLE